MTTNPTRRFAVLGACLFLGIWLLWRWYAPDPLPDRGGFVPATTEKTVDSVPKIDVPTTSVKAIPKTSKPVKKLGLPPEIVKDDKVVILDVVEIPDCQNGATAVVTLDTDSGQPKTYVKPKPRPLFALEKGGEVGVRYGVGSGGEVGTVFVRQDLLRVGSLYLAAYGEVTTDPEIVAGLQASYRW
jgi:hypothetical protein